MKKTDTVYNKTVLDSGLTIVSERIPYVRSVSIGFWVKTGSRNENQNNNGISHFLEHMVFKGTKKRKAFEIAESLESLGGTINAYTAKENTCFFAHLLDEHLPLAVDVLSDIVQEPRLDRNDVEKEKLVVAEEINSINDNAEELIYDYFQGNLFKGNSLSFPVLGLLKNIKELNRESIVEYWKTNYRANNFVIAASGNLVHDDLVELLVRHFKLPSTDTETIYNRPGESDHRVQSFTKKILQSHACIGFKGISYSDNLKFALLVLNTFFGNGMSSRLFQNIREKYGFTYSLYSFNDFYSDTGDFGIYIAFDKNKKKKALDLIINEFSKLKKREYTEKEVERSKSQLKGNIMLGLENTASRMFRLGKMEIYLGQYTNLDSVLNRIECVNDTYINEVIDQIIDMDKMFQVVLEPD